MRSEEMTDATNDSGAHTREARSDARGDHVSHSDGASRTHPACPDSVHCASGGQVPTRNCPLTDHMHMHLTSQTHTRQLRAFTNTPPRARPCVLSVFDSRRHT